MNFTDEHRLTFTDNHSDTPGEVVLAEPTDEQWNTYTAGQYNAKGHEVKIRTVQASAKLFDEICTSLKNVHAKGIEVTLETIHLIPARAKHLMIASTFVTGFQVTEDFSSRDSIASSDDSESQDAESADS